MQKNKIQRAFYIISILVIPFILCSCSNKNSNKKVKLNEVTRSIFYCPQYLAIELGYFKDENISIDLTTSNGSDKTMTSILSSQSDIGLLGPETAIYVYNQGRTNFGVLFAQLTKRDGSLIVGHDKTDFSWDDLKNKKIISGRKGGLPEMTLNYVLKNNGLIKSQDTELITNIQLDLVGTAFTKSMADYVCLFEPTASIIQKEKKGFILRPIGKEIEEIPYTCYCCSKKYLKENSEVIQGFTNAIYKAQIFMKNSSPQEIAKIIENYFPDTETDILISSIQNYMEYDVWASSPMISKSSFELLKKIMYESDQLNSDVEFEKIINNSFAKKSVQNLA